MRRRTLLSAVPAGLGLATLVACGSEDSGSSSSSSGTASKPAGSGKIVDGPLPDITDGKKFGEKPTVAKGSGDPSKDLAVRAAVTGTGKKVAENDFVQAQYLGQIWDTAKVFDNSYDRGAPLLMQLKQGAAIEGWVKGIPGHRVGDRLEMAVPPELGYGTQGNADAGIKGTDTLVFVIDIEDSFNSKSSAKGKSVELDDESLPVVAGNTDGKSPKIDVPGGKAPKKLVSEYVIEGDGEKVKAEDTLLLQYKGVLWDNGKEFDSTYSRDELANFPLAQLIKGWQEGLAGKKVGSRVMLVVPPDLGYGDQESGAIPANSTLVFSLDILAKM